MFRALLALLWPKPPVSFDTHSVRITLDADKRVCDIKDAVGEYLIRIGSSVARENEVDLVQVEDIDMVASEILEILRGDGIEI